MWKYTLLQLEEPGRGSPSVEGVARTHWIPQLLQVLHHPTLIIIVKIHFIKMLEMTKILMIMMTVWVMLMGQQNNCQVVHLYILHREMATDSFNLKEQQYVHCWMLSVPFPVLSFNFIWNSGISTVTWNESPFWHLYMYPLENLENLLELLKLGQTS